MRLLVRMLAALGLVALSVGLIISAPGIAMYCFDGCRQGINFAGDLLPKWLPFVMPGLVSTGCAWFLCLGLLHRTQQSRRLVWVLLSLPLVVAAFLLLVVVNNNGSLVPTTAQELATWPTMLVLVLPMVACWPLAVFMGARTLSGQRPVSPAETSA